MPHLILYDSQCGLCSRFVQFVLKRDRKARFHFCSLQSDRANQLLSPFSPQPDSPDTVLVIANYLDSSAKLLARSSAALFVLSQLGFGWKVLGVLRLIPITLRDGIYDWVARNRRRWFRQPLNCPFPTPDQRDRFLT